MNNTIRTSRFAALIIAVVGLITLITGQSTTAHTPSVELLAWCTDTSLLPRTPDAAEAWLRACQSGDGDNDLLPTNPDAGLERLDDWPACATEQSCGK
jgi:hypothetical protein